MIESGASHREASIARGIQRHPLETADLLGTTRWTEARIDLVADGNGNGYLQGHVYGSNLIRVGCSCHGSTVSKASVSEASVSDDMRLHGRMMR